MDLKKAFNSVRKEGRKPFIIFQMSFGIPMKLVRLIKKAFK
jgi:hypothetical protein